MYMVGWVAAVIIDWMRIVRGRKDNWLLRKGRGKALHIEISLHLSSAWESLNA